MRRLILKQLGHSACELHVVLLRLMWKAELQKRMKAEREVERWVRLYSRRCAEVAEYKKQLDEVLSK